MRPPRELAALYRRASVGVVFSLTTHSLVAQEMMASGLPVVELEGDNVASALGESGELVELAERTPDAIADAIERLLDDREHAAAMARARARLRRGAHVGAGRRPGRGGAARLPVAAARQARPSARGRRPGARRRLTHAGLPPSGGPR